jgi:hypothetical protein
MNECLIKPKRTLPFKTRIKIIADEVKIALAKAAIGPNK